MGHPICSPSPLHMRREANPIYSYRRNSPFLLQRTDLINFIRPRFARAERLALWKLRNGWRGSAILDSVCVCDTRWYVVKRHISFPKNIQNHPGWATGRITFIVRNLLSKQSGTMVSWYFFGKWSPFFQKFVPVRPSQHLSASSNISLHRLMSHRDKILNETSIWLIRCRFGFSGTTLPFAKLPWAFLLLFYRSFLNFHVSRDASQYQRC